MAEIVYYHFTPTGLHYSVNTFEEIVDDFQEGGFVWLNYYSPEKNDLMALVDTFGVHPLSIEDCLDTSQVPKIEHFPGNTFILFNSFSYIEKALFIDEIDIFLGKNFLITVSGINSDGRKPLNDVRRIVEKDPGLGKSGPAFLMHLIMDYVVDEKFKAIEALEDDIDEAEEKVLDDPSTFKPTGLIRLRKDLLNLRKSLFHEREILVKICRKDCPFIQEKAIFHYRDVYDHLAKFFELTETYKETVTSLMELYTSLLNNLMTKVSNKTNASVRRLTLIATIFMPLTLIASIGGMSEWTMMTGGPSRWKVAYPLFLLGMLITGIAGYILIRRLEKGIRDKEEDVL